MEIKTMTILVKSCLKTFMRPFMLHHILLTPFLLPFITISLLLLLSNYKLIFGGKDEIELLNAIKKG